MFTAIFFANSIGCTQRHHDSIRTECLAVLEIAMGDESFTVVAHAAEAKIAAGQSDGLRGRVEAALSAHEAGPGSRELRVILASRVLHQLGDRQAVDSVLAILNDPASSQRPAAAETLGKLRHRSAIEHVRRAVSEENQPECSALWAYGTGALAKCGDPAAQRAMLGMGFLSPCPNVRRITANDLGEVGLPEALPHIRAMVAHEPDPLTRVNAAGALLQYGDHAGWTILRDALRHHEPIMRKHAARGLRASSRIDAAVCLLGPLLEDDDADVRVMAADSILRLLRHAPP